MNSHRLNLLVMAVLGALLLFFGTRTVLHIMAEEAEPEKPGYDVPGTKTAAKSEGETPAENAPAQGGAGAEVLPLLASADPKKGEADAAPCKICHTFDKGGPAVVGPNLFDVIGRPIASVEGFNYTALKTKKDLGPWTYELLDIWLTNPQAFAPGTSMAFPGLPDIKQRADVIAFLRSKHDNPPPLPAAGGAAPAPAEAPKAEAPAAPAPEAAPAPSEQPASPPQ